MVPQVILTDSTKKGIDKLPFAPFLNKEKIESLKETSADTIKKKPGKNILKSPAKNQQAGVTTAKADTVRATSFKYDSVNSFTPVPVFDNLLSPGDSLANTAADEFRFSDDTSASFTNDYVSNPYTSSETYFKSQMLRPRENNPAVFNKPVPDWFTIILLVMIAGVTAIKILYRKIFSQMTTAFFSLAVTNQIVRDENMLVQRATILLNIIFYGVGALFLYQLSVLFNWDHPVLNEGIIRFFLFAIMLACIYSLKMILLKFLSFIFELDKSVSTYIFSMFLINNSVGLVLIPVIAAYTYVAFAKNIWVIYFSIALVVTAFIFRLWRATTIGLGMPRFSLYYLFLYFCALEIAPVLIILKATGLIG